MKKYLLAFALLCFAAPAVAQTFPLGNIPVGLGPGKTGWRAIAPGADGNCIFVVGGQFTSATCPGSGTGGSVSTLNAGPGITLTPNPTTTVGSIACTPFTSGLPGCVPLGSTNPIRQLQPAGSWAIPTALTIQSRTAAAALDLTGVNAVQTLGYAAAGDGGGAIFKNVGSTKFIDQGLLTGTITTPGSGYVDGTYTVVVMTAGSATFGPWVRATVSGGAVTSVTPTAQSGSSIAVGDVLTVPNSYLGGTGSGFTYTVTSVVGGLASFTDAAGNHFQYVVDQGAYPNIRQFGAKIDWNGVDATATDDYNSWTAAIQFTGVMSNNVFADSGGFYGGKLLAPRGSSLICGPGNKSLIFPFGGILEGGGGWNTTMKMCDAFDPTKHFIEICDPTILIACLNTTIRNISIFANRNVVAAIGAAMVHTNAAQDIGGLDHVMIFAGQRMCSWYEKGYGGASTMGFDTVQCTAAGANTMMQFGNSVASGLNLGSSIIKMGNIVLGGPSSLNLQTGPGIVLQGGHFTIDGVHCELIVVCIEVAIPTATLNGDIVGIHNVNAGGGPPGTPCTGVIQLDPTNRPGNTVIGRTTGSCTNIITNAQPGGVSYNAQILKDITCVSGSCS